MSKSHRRAADGRLERRQFLKSGLVAAGGAVVAATAAGSAPAEAAETSGIPLRKFGKTGRTLPVLGMGGSAMVVRFIAGYGMPLLPMEKRVAMVRHAYDRGIRYFDTARIYGESETIFGRGLKGVRDKVFIATKVHTTDPAAVRKSLETSLEQLQTDHVDCVQVHSPCIERVGFDGAMKIHAELVKLRDKGLLKSIGLTTHVAFETVYKLIATGGFDQALLAYGYFRKGMDTMLSNSNVEWRDLCLAKCHELRMAVVAMKVLGASIFSHNAKKLLPDYDEEKLAKLPGAAIRWVLRDERVSMLNIGVSAPGDIDRNLETIKGDLKLTAEDRSLLADFSRKAYQTPTVKGMRVT